MRKVSLRKITENDTNNIIKWRNTSFVQRNFIYQNNLTKDEHEKWLNSRVIDGDVEQFIIVDEEIGDVGSIYLRDINLQHRKAEFGIFIGEKSACGKGIGTQAAKLLLKYAFENMHLNKIFLRVFADNIGAIKSYEKVGFVEEGIFREDVLINEKPKDVVFMGIVRREWENEN